ncbi:MerR family DNA-binding protein, partial [Pseudomonas aeruginosa]|uniref:MerR family DNA-binding protein n=2 Tax=Pseudomonas aeruginosa TaxID=287 RepID=UPI0023B2F1F2
LVTKSAIRPGSNFNRQGGSIFHQRQHRCRILDLSLTEIRELQSYQDDPRQPCTAVNAMLDDHISHVRSQITALQALEQQLVSLRASCNEGREINACGILTGISEESKQQLYRASSGRKD